MESKYIPAQNLVDRVNVSMANSVNEYIQKAMNDYSGPKTAKYEKFKSDLEGMENISTVAEAKSFIKNLLPNMEQNHIIHFENATCTIYDEPNRFRVVLDSDEEMICYDFTK